MPLNINSGLDLSGLAGGNPYANLTGNAQGDLAALGANYGRQQQASVGLNSQLHNNVMAGYKSILDYHDQQAQGITGQYGQLSQDVLGGIKGIDASQRQAIADAYQQQQGAANQSLQSRGLANSTVVDSTNRGLMLDKQKADVALSNATAGLTAGYQSQLGLAGLGFQGQALQQQTGLGLGQLGAMERVNVGYPQAGAYSQIAGMIGANRQADQNRQLAMQGLAMQRPQATGGGVQPGGGQGFFGSNPYAYTGGGQVSPPPMGGGFPQQPQSAPSFGPPGYASAGSYRGPGAATGVAPGADRGAYDLSNEDQPYGQAPGSEAGYGRGPGGIYSGYGGIAVGGGMFGALGQPGSGFNPWGNGGYGFGSYGGGAQGPAAQNPYADYGYGAGGGGNMNDGTQSSADFYFGGDE